MLLPFDLEPPADPDTWELLGRYGEDVTAVVGVGGGPRTGRDPAYTSAIRRMEQAGVRVLGYVDVGYGTRSLERIVADASRWAGYPVRGIFVDRAPTSAFSIGPVAAAVHAARRAGLPDAVLNPGTAPDPLYRDLRAAVCVFDGSWQEYQDWSGDGAEPGDGHLVHGVPADQLDAARALVSARGAGFALISDVARPTPDDGLPAWCGLALAR